MFYKINTFGNLFYVLCASMQRGHNDDHRCRTGLIFTKVFLKFFVRLHFLTLKKNVLKMHCLSLYFLHNKYALTGIYINERVSPYICFQVIGTDRRPSILDRDSMPYVQATLYESLRLCPIGECEGVLLCLPFLYYYYYYTGKILSRSL